MRAASQFAPGRWWTDAPALRFLSLFLLGWVGLRAAMPVAGVLWSEDIMAASRGEQNGLPNTVPKPVNAEPIATMKEIIGREVAGNGFGEATSPKAVPIIKKTSGKWRLDRAKPVSVAEAFSSVEERAPYESALPAAAAGLVSPRRKETLSGGSGWSLSTWLFLRDNIARSASNLPVAGELGGSQAGLRAGYGLDKAGRVDVYGRVTAALGHVQQSELAFGVSAAPVAGLPVRVAAERRERLGRDGRSAMAVMIVGGVSAKPLPANFRLDAYGQAGLVGVNSRDAFVDGAVVIDHALDIAKEARSLRVGAVLAGAAQPHVERIDVGPRVTLPIPQIGKGARLAVDWRQRVAGNALPKNGASLTFGADF